MSRADFSFFHPLRVRWSEADMQGIVFNGHYMAYFDVAFTEYWRALGLPSPVEQSKTGCELFMRKVTLEFQAPARFDEVIDIGVRCVALGRSSMRFALEIHRAEQHLISGELVYVYADTTVRKGVPLPLTWREIICVFEKLAPEI